VVHPAPREDELARLPATPENAPRAQSRRRARRDSLPTAPIIGVRHRGRAPRGAIDVDDGRRNRHPDRCLSRIGRCTRGDRRRDGSPRHRERLRPSPRKVPSKSGSSTSWDCFTGVVRAGVRRDPAAAGPARSLRDRGSASHRHLHTWRSPTLRRTRSPASAATVDPSQVDSHEGPSTGS
jgi:hypothetical protein